MEKNVYRMLFRGDKFYVLMTHDVPGVPGSTNSDLLVFLWAYRRGHALSSTRWRRLHRVAIALIYMIRHRQQQHIFFPYVCINLFYPSTDWQKRRLSSPHFQQHKLYPSQQAFFSDKCHRLIHQQTSTSTTTTHWYYVRTTTKYLPGDRHQYLLLFFSHQLLLLLYYCCIAW